MARLLYLCSAFSALCLEAQSTSPGDKHEPPEGIAQHRARCCVSFRFTGVNRGCGNPSTHSALVARAPLIATAVAGVRTGRTPPRATPRAATETRSERAVTFCSTRAVPWALGDGRALTLPPASRRSTPAAARDRDRRLNRCRRLGRPRGQSRQGEEGGMVFRARLAMTGCPSCLDLPGVAGGQSQVLAGARGI